VHCDAVLHYLQPNGQAKHYYVVASLKNPSLQVVQVPLNCIKIQFGTTKAFPKHNFS
jgi:hypothetical protein